MFKKVFQGGSHVEVFSVQGRDPLSSWKLTGSVSRDYLKDLRGYVVTMEGGASTTNTRMQLPKADKTSLGLTQSYLVFQLLIPEGARVAIDLGLLDVGGSKRRIQLSTSQRETAATPLNARVPLTGFLNDQWLNLCLDLGSLVSGLFKAQDYKSLESISLGGTCQLRRIFTLKTCPPNTSGEESVGRAVEEVPKACQMPAAGPAAHTQVITYSTLNGPSHKRETSTASTSDSTTTGDEQRTHIAFGQKVAIPDHILASKQGTRSTLPSRQSSAEKLRGVRDGDSLDGQALKPRPPSKPPTDPTVLRVQKKRVRMISAGKKNKTEAPKDNSGIASPAPTDGVASTGPTSPVHEGVESDNSHTQLDQDEQLALEALKHKDNLSIEQTDNREDTVSEQLNTSALSEDYLHSTLNTSGASRQSLDSSVDDVVYLYRSLPKSAERHSTDVKESQIDGGRSVALEEDFVSPVREASNRGALSFMPPVPQIRQRAAQQNQIATTEPDNPRAEDESVETQDDVREDMVQTRLSDDYDWRQYASVDGELPQSDLSLRTRLARAATTTTSSSTVRAGQADSGMEGTLSGSVTHSGWTERFKQAANNPLHDSLDTHNMGGMLSPLGGTLTDGLEFPMDQPGTGEELELMYDSQLNCFYDPVTGKYYELA